MHQITPFFATALRQYHEDLTVNDLGLQVNFSKQAKFINIEPVNDDNQLFFCIYMSLDIILDKWVFACVLCESSMFFLPSDCCIFNF